MITRAAHDLEVYSPALGPALESYPEVSQVQDQTATDELIVEYADGTQRRIFAPTYAASSHAVLRDEPQKMRSDVTEFLNSR